jgi:hypothetical protein
MNQLLCFCFMVEEKIDAIGFFYKSEITIS